MTASHQNTSVARLTLACSGAFDPASPFSLSPTGPAFLKGAGSLSGEGMTCPTTYAIAVKAALEFAFSPDPQQRVPTGRTPEPVDQASVACDYLVSNQPAPVCGGRLSGRAAS